MIGNYKCQCATCQETRSNSLTIDLRRVYGTRTFQAPAISLYDPQVEAIRGAQDQKDALRMYYEKQEAPNMVKGLAYGIVFTLGFASFLWFFGVCVGCFQ